MLLIYVIYFEGGEDIAERSEDLGELEGHTCDNEHEGSREKEEAADRGDYAVCDLALKGHIEKEIDDGNEKRESGEGDYSDARENKIIYDKREDVEE